MEVSKSTAVGEGLSKARAGVPAVFQIKSIDRMGNKRTAGEHRLCNPHQVLHTALAAK